MEYQILCAVALDLALGDPRWLPHPVRGIGRLTGCLERLGRRWLGFWPRIAGLAVALAVYLIVGLAAWGGIRLAGFVATGTFSGPLWAEKCACPLADLVSIVVIYWAIAPRDLLRHSMAVYRALAAGELVEARRRVAQIVGRDTAGLDEAEIVRAAVESVAESTVDGVTAPLVFAAVAGPVGAIVYRAVNTLDSMLGHREEPYAEFGWAAARIDDLANYVPARLTAPLVCLAALVLRRRPWAALKVLARDGRRHPSPNAGLAEAAAAGALGIRLGGRNYYDGRPSDGPTLGDPLVPLSPRHIVAANRLMLATTGLVLALLLPLRMAVVHYLGI
ncbi:MAG: adenosylcobinamide-phosphate synthase CbiB [Thermoguttaceae bacterium]